MYNICKKVFTTTSVALLSLSALTTVNANVIDRDQMMDEIATVWDKVYKADTYTVSVIKDSFANLEQYNKALTTDSSLDTADLDDMRDSDFVPYIYATKDRNTVYATALESSILYPNYLKGESRTLEGVSNLNFSLFTKVSDRAINFEGSNDNELKVSTYWKVLQHELMPDLFDVKANLLADKQPNEIKYIYGLIADKFHAGKYVGAGQLNLTKSTTTISEDPGMPRFPEMPSLPDLPWDVQNELSKNMENTDFASVSLAKLSASEILVKKAEFDNDAEYDRFKDDDTITYVAKDRKSAAMIREYEGALYFGEVSFSKENHVGKTTAHFYTDVSEQKLNFHGSNDTAAHVTFERGYVW